MRRTSRRRVLRAAFLLSGQLGPSFWPAALAAQPLAARSIEREGAESTLPGLEPFVDGVVASHMAEHVAGTQVAVVKDGLVLLVKGYGLAQVAPERAVDPERTLFRIASISKTFTWLALMQLADAGKLRLEDDVNAHLPRELKLASDGFHKPVRIVDLMNHSAGFEEPVLLDDPSDETLLRSAREALQRRPPARVREPGKLFSYSNDGARLAGAIVTALSGLDFESYIEQHIFWPLGMRRSTFREPYGRGAPLGLPLPMPAELAADRATALVWQAGQWRPQPHQYLLPDAPASSAASTASDMARYMVALLEPALLESAGVLSARSAAIFRQESFKSAPGLRGIHHGFFDAALGRHSKLGYANLSHGGSAAHFESYLSLVPELRLGVFVTTNSASGLNLARDVPEQLVRHYFPLKPAAARAKNSARALSHYAGDYRDLRRFYTKLPALFAIDDVQTIRVGESDCLMVALPWAGPACFVRIGRDLFEKADGDARISFVRDARGAITHVLGAVNAERVTLLDSGLWLRACLGAGLIAVLGVMLGALRRWRRQVEARRFARAQDQVVAKTRGQQLSAYGMALVALSWLAFYITGAAWLVFYGGDPLRDYPQPLLVFALRTLVAAVFVTWLSVLMLPLVLRGAGFSLARRLRHTLVLLVLLGLCSALARWNAIGFHYF